MWLNPFSVDSAEPEATRRGIKAVPATEAKTVTDWHRPGVQLLGQLMAQKYGAEIFGMFSWSGLGLFVWAARPAAQSLLQDPAVTGVEEISDDRLVLSGPMSVHDTVSGSEVIPWAKTYVGANDAITTSNRFYLIDTNLPNPTPSTELNVVYQLDVPDNSATPQVNSLHSTHIAALVGANGNNYLTRGINPGQPIVALGFGEPGPISNLELALDRAFALSELINDFSVLNLSANAGGPFYWDQVLGKKLRIMSNRFLVAQSAGNDGDVACYSAYNYEDDSKQNDGILVVGGVNPDGSRMTGGLNPVPNGPAFMVNGSNYGYCVEAWAPAFEMTSLTTYPTEDTRVSTGTSYAAPVVAALASRYGDSSTRPVQREQYIVNHLYTTGYLDHASIQLPIGVARYTPPTSANVLKRHAIASIASASNSAGLTLLYDGKFSNGIWNAQSNWGEITIDLGTVKTVKGIRLSLVSSAVVPPRTSPITQQPIQFSILGGSTSANNLIRYWTEPFQLHGAPIYIPIPATSARYIRIDASNSHSWVAYSEVEVYGD